LVLRSLHRQCQTMKRVKGKARRNITPRGKGVCVWKMQEETDWEEVGRGESKLQRGGWSKKERREKGAYKITGKELKKT